MDDVYLVERFIFDYFFLAVIVKVTGLKVDTTQESIQNRQESQQAEVHVFLRPNNGLKVCIEVLGFKPNTFQKT